MNIAQEVEWVHNYKYTIKSRDPYSAERIRDQDQEQGLDIFRSIIHMGI